MIIDLSLPFNPESPSLKDFADEAQAKRASALMRLGHFGTHLDRLKGSQIPVGHFKSPGLCLDVRQRDPSGPLRAGDLDLSSLAPGGFLILRTGVMEDHPYASEGYLSAHFEVGWDLLDAILDKGIHLIGLDARGLRPDRDHPKADTICESRGAFVIENLANLALLPMGAPLTLYAAVFDMGGTGLPVKVFAEFA